MFSSFILIIIVLNLAFTSDYDADTDEYYKKAYEGKVTLLYKTMNCRHITLTDCGEGTILVCVLIRSNFFKNGL